MSNTYPISAYSRQELEVLGKAAPKVEPQSFAGCPVFVGAATIL